VDLSVAEERAVISQTIASSVLRLSQPRSGVGRIAWRNATAAVVLVLAYLPSTAGLLEEGWSGPHYKFVPLALLCAGVLTMRAWRQPSLAQAQTENNLRDAVLLGMAWATLLAAILAGSRALTAVSALLFVIALVDGRGRWPLLRRYTPALVLLCLAIPLPHNAVSRLSLGFQSLVTRGAATVLDRLAVPNLRSGIVLDLADRQCLVDEAASGADGVLLVLVITMFYAFSARRSAPSIVILLAAALFWAMAAGVARLAGVAYLAAQRGESLSRGWATAVLGLVAVAATLTLVLSTDRLLWFLGAVLRRRPFWIQAQNPCRAKAIPDTEDGALLQPRGLVSWQFIAAFGLLAMLQVPLFYATSASQADVRRKLDTLTEETMPAAWGSWQRLGFEAKQRPAGHPLGSRSRVWRYRWGLVQATLAVDDPAPSSAVLPPYFQSLGWTVTESTRCAEGVVSNFREYRLDKPLGRSAVMFVGRFDAQEQPVDVASSRRSDQPGSFFSPLAEPGGQAAANHQVELLVESPRPLTDNETGQARVFFRFAQHLLHEFARQPEEVRP
jgi:exosortase